MPKPSNYPDFATDTNYTNGPDVGTPTKIQPSSGELAEGHVGGTAPPAQKFNWWQNLVGLWVRWIEVKVTDRADTFTANGTWTCPEGVTSVDLYGCGGGGGGGGGQSGTTTTDEYAHGGSGGGGGLPARVTMTVTPGVVYTITIGSGGVGGNPDSDGNTGEPTVFAAPGPTILANFLGGGPGYSAVVSEHSDTQFVVPGVSGDAGGAMTVARKVAQNEPHQRQPGAGGYGLPRTAAALGVGDGAFSHVGGLSGLEGASVGVDSGSYRGGGPGGGGGGALFVAAVNARGGNGGNANSGGIANSGGSGQDGIVNTGVGGGGGGGGGAGLTAGVGGFGGNGGSGTLVIRYRGPQAVIA